MLQIPLRVFRVFRACLFVLFFSFVFFLFSSGMISHNSKKLKEKNKQKEKFKNEIWKISFLNFFPCLPLPSLSFSIRGGNIEARVNSFKVNLNCFLFFFFLLGLLNVVVNPQRPCLLVFMVLIFCSIR